MGRWVGLGMPVLCLPGDRLAAKLAIPTELTLRGKAIRLCK